MPEIRDFCRTAPIIWALLSFPFVNGIFMVRNAGNCASNEFWYEPIQDCIPLGNQLSQNIPPHGITCPSKGSWYWSSPLSACLPTGPVPDISSPGSITCPTHYAWNPTKSSCTQVGHVQRLTPCDVTEFWFSEKATCLRRRDSRASSTRCPRGWYWNTQLTSCAPASPEALLSLTCGDDLVWSPSTLVCERTASVSQSSATSTPSSRPSPSSSPGQHLHRRRLKSRAVTLCPHKLYACPLFASGDLSDYECIDPIYDLQHCGGCSVDGRGEDCTSIEGVWNVECTRARCSVLTCMIGYIPSVDQRTCVRL